MFRTVFIICCLFFSAGEAATQTVFPFASKQCRDSVTTQLKQQIDHTIKLPLNDSTSQQWMSAFWAMELLLYKPGLYRQKISSQIKILPKQGPGFQRAFLEMLYTLYPSVYAKAITAVYKELKPDKVKAMALEYLSTAGSATEIQLDSLFKKSLYYRQYLYVQSKEQQPLPVKNQFTDTSFLSEQTILCSFQSPNRNTPGYLMIRMPNGQWLKDEKGDELKFTQLARSISNLPFYFTNGNTPQGLYKITGVDTSDNNWIGPTTNLQMILPFENKASDFFGTDTAYESFYKNLLGTKLNLFKGLWESYWAGKLDRTEIIAHGTTINPLYYQTQPYYPNTPSLGCLCSPEIWNDTGELMYSSQQNWIQLILSKKINPSWLVVAEIADL
jgi:hypothetical protein